MASAAARSAFVDVLNSIQVIGAVVALASGLLTASLIRRRDFVCTPRPDVERTVDSAATA